MLAEILMLVGLVSAVPKRGRFPILTTNDRTVDLDGRPNDGIAGGLTPHIC